MLTPVIVKSHPRSTGLLRLPSAAGLFHAPSSSADTSEVKLGAVQPACGCLTSENTSKSWIGRIAAALNQSIADYPNSYFPNKDGDQVIRQDRGRA